MRFRLWHPHTALAIVILSVVFRRATQPPASRGNADPPSERDRYPAPAAGTIPFRREIAWRTSLDGTKLAIATCDLYVLDLATSMPEARTSDDGRRPLTQAGSSSGREVPYVSGGQREGSDSDWTLGFRRRGECLVRSGETAGDGHEGE